MSTEFLLNQHIVCRVQILFKLFITISNFFRNVKHSQTKPVSISENKNEAQEVKDATPEEKSNAF